MTALIELKLSANAQFQDRDGACKLIETAAGRSDLSMAPRLPECRATCRAATRRGGPAGMIDAVTKPKTKVKTKTERPRLHKVILVNDDFTPREFVVTVLKAEFRMTEDQAHKVMITAHRRGVCVVAVFTKDVAETKATRATDAGRAKGYPLLFTTEPEE
jgi:ATP-dependent Clp protease adaptor protein ClpS